MMRMSFSAVRRRAAVSILDGDDDDVQSETTGGLSEGLLVSK